jgi:5-hydroxyisourate hydrolase-like protein (transthyretin family)
MTRPSVLRCFVALAVGMAVLCTPPFVAAVSSDIPVGGYQVSGTVVNKIGGHPLAGARVVVGDTRNRDRVVWMVTAEDGRFTFHIPAGKFSLGAEKRGFLTTSYKQHEQFSTAIVTGAGFDTESLVIQLAPNAVLKGKVMDEAGEPVRNATVTVYRESRESGISQIRAVLQSTTNDQGTYEATPLDDGTYFVCVTAKPWYAVHGTPSPGAEGTLPTAVDSSLDVAYPTTYYGDVTESDDATPIPIRGGDKVEADIHVGPVAALHLKLRVPADGSQRFVRPMFFKPSFDGMERVETGQMMEFAPGQIEITGIPAGRYTLRAFAPPNTALPEPTEVELSSTSSELDMSSGNPTSTVKVKLQVVGETKVPVPLRVAMRNNKGRVAQVRPVSAEGEAIFTNVSSGEYGFTAGSPNEPYSVRIASANGGAEGLKLNVAPGSSLEVALSLVGGEVTVEGVAQRAGKPFSGAMVVLVPKDPEAKRQFFRRDQSDMDGTFSLLQVFPGTYTVIAIEDGWDLDWAKPEVLSQHTKHAQTIVVASQAKGSSRLAEPVEVQPK